MTDVRLIQVARIFGLSRDEITVESARRTIAANPERFAGALFEEAAASDDVISEATALEYLEGRFAFLGDLLDANVRTDVERDFVTRLKSWLEVPRA